MFKQKGFTLIELLGTIIILTAIVLIVAPLVINQVSKSKVQLSEQTEKSVVMSATNWANDHKKYLPDNNKEGAIWVGILQEEGYLEDDITDPSGENINNGCVVISNREGAYYYDYHSGEEEKNGEKICDSLSLMSQVVFDAQKNNGYIKESGEGVKTVNAYNGSSMVVPDAVSNRGADFRFNGWHLDDGQDSDNTSVELVPGSALTITKNDTYFAVFEKPAKKAKIILNANGGSGTTSSNSSCTILPTFNNEELETSCPAELPQNNYTRNGYKFVGWNTNPNASSGLQPGTMVNLSADTTYYAIWKRNTYKVTYNYSANGGTSASVTSKEFEPGASVDLNVTAYKSGWTFMGWSTSSNSTSTISSYKMPEKNITLYAVYKKSSKSYRITTNGNGGSGTAYTSSCTIPEVYNNSTQKTSCTAVLPSNGFSRSGYSFNGWSTSSSASSGSSPGTTVTLSSNKTYYATWRKNVTTKTYTVTFKSNGRTYSTKSCSTTGTSCSVTAPGAPTSSSYKPSNATSFKFWGTTSTATTGKSAYSSISVSSSKTYYAVWNTSSSGGGTTKTRTATFYSNGYSYATRSCTTTSTSCTVTTPSAPTSSTYKPSGATSFKAWGTTSTATSGVSANSSVSLSSNKSYYAIWNKSATATDRTKPKVWIAIIGDGVQVAGDYNTTVTAPGTYSTISLNISIADYVNGVDDSAGYGSGFYNGSFTMGFEGGSQIRYGTLENNGTRISGIIDVTTPGNRTVSITVTDKAGNTSSATAKFTLAEPKTYVQPCRQGITMVYDDRWNHEQWLTVRDNIVLDVLGDYGDMYYVRIYSGGWWAESNQWYNNAMANAGEGYIYKKCTRSVGGAYCAYNTCPNY